MHTYMHKHTEREKETVRRDRSRVSVSLSTINAFWWVCLTKKVLYGLWVDINIMSASWWVYFTRKAVYGLWVNLRASRRDGTGSLCRLCASKRFWSRLIRVSVLQDGLTFIPLSLTDLTSVCVHPECVWWLRSALFIPLRASWVLRGVLKQSNSSGLRGFGLQSSLPGWVFGLYDAVGWLAYSPAWW